MPVAIKTFDDMLLDNMLVGEKGKKAPMWPEDYETWDITTSQKWVAPKNDLYDIFLVGGGGGGGSRWGAGGSSSGGGGGYTTLKSVPLKVGDELNIMIGSGGIGPYNQNADGGAGGDTVVFCAGLTVALAAGGNGGPSSGYAYWYQTADGGSGGGMPSAGGKNEGQYLIENPEHGGSNGKSTRGGWGQGYSTRAFGEADGLLCSGGGGGGANTVYVTGGSVINEVPGAGGAGGGGAGGAVGESGADGTNGLGGGGGGAGQISKGANGKGGTGGSGRVMIRRLK